MGIAQTHPYEDDVLPRGTASCVATLARRYLAGRDALFEQRIAGGHARDGHGDLLADDIFCLDDGPRAIDCLEFDDRLRYGDVLADVAFLAMDLERLGRPDLSRVFLDRYRDAAQRRLASTPSNTCTSPTAPRARQDRMPAAWTRRSVRRDRSRLLASTRARSSRDGTCATGARRWAAGSGKSTLAEAIGEKLGWVVLRSDVVRKELAGLAPTRAPMRHWIKVCTPRA